jgi:hypothetical protein
VKNAKSAHEVWSKLHILYETRNTTNRLIFKKRLSNMRMKEGESMIEYLDKFKTSLEDLESIGAPLSQEDAIATLLNSLPSSFDNLVISLESKGEDLNLDYVQARLLQEELRRDKRSEEDESLLLTKTNNKEKEEANVTKTEKKSFSKDDLNKITCYYCNKKGHFASRCFKNIFDKNKGGEEAHHTQGGDEYLFSSSHENQQDDLWYLDSGATMHMTHKRYVFKTYEKLSKPRMVKMGDNNTQKGIGIGNVHIK